MQEIQEENFIDCEPLDPIFCNDTSGKQFYASLRVHDFNVTINSCVRIALDVIICQFVKVIGM